MRGVLLTLGLAFTAALAGCSSYVCNAATCARGCCQGGSCYEGEGKTGGISCDASAGGGGGTTGSGGGTGGGTGGGGGACVPQGNDCNTSSDCCPGTGINCGYNVCQPSNCGTYDDPCNASAPCCLQGGSGSSNMGHVCNTTRERCDLCGARGYDCSSQYASACCPGLSCLLKPGYTSIYVCQ